MKGVFAAGSDPPYVKLVTQSQALTVVHKVMSDCESIKADIYATIYRDADDS